MFMMGLFKKQDQNITELWLRNMLHMINFLINASYIEKNKVKICNQTASCFFMSTLLHSKV